MHVWKKGGREGIISASSLPRRSHRGMKLPRRADEVVFVAPMPMTPIPSHHRPVTNAAPSAARPPFTGATLLQRAEEVISVGAAIARAKTVLVNGSGLSGLEIAGDARAQNSMARVIVLSRDGGVLKQSHGPEMQVCQRGDALWGLKGVGAEGGSWRGRAVAGWGSAEAVSWTGDTSAPQEKREVGMEYFVGAALERETSKEMARVSDASHLRRVGD